jgi:peptidoglycan hydrolase-like protein with peptidoglycan-binding domain
LIYKGSRPDRIAAYQKTLGLAADGKIGPKTRAKVLSLTGRTI